MQDRIKIEGTNIEELLYLRLKRFTSFNLCKKLIKKRKPDLSSEIIDAKSSGLAATINAFLGFFDFENRPLPLNLWVLTRYYTLLQLTIAEQLVVRDDIKSIEDIEKSTRYGHGLKTIYKNKNDLLTDFKIYMKKSGYLYEYVKYLGYNIEDISTDRNISDVNDTLLFSLEELFLRVPEFYQYKTDFFSKAPYFLNIWFKEQIYCDNNGNKIQCSTFNKPEQPCKKRSYLLIKKPTPIDLDDYSLPLIKATDDSLDGISDNECLTYYLDHDNTYWWEELKLYKSSYSASSLILPLKKIIDDAIIINFMLLYALSIIVRYYPSIWNKIEYGEFDNIRAIIEYYLSIFDKIVLEKMIERIEGVKVDIALTGSLNSTI